jgi:alcohol dehydrogenase class IV
MRFEFATSTRIIFGPGTSKELASAAAVLGHRVLIVTNKIGDPNVTLLESLSGRGINLLNSLSSQGLDPIVFTVAHEPTVDLVLSGTQLARDMKRDLVIGLGGGSAIDTGKAISALLTNTDDPFDYLEVIGKGKPLTQKPAPFIAVPTTAGTGAEVTRNAVLESPQHQIKVSLRSPMMLPQLAIVDPELTYHLPRGVTASTGLDALTQVLEPFVSRKANPLTDSFCREGLERAARSLKKVYDSFDDPLAHEDMSMVSLFGGLALANAGLGAVHGFAGVLGGMFHGPHGAICACLLPYVMMINVRVLQERSPESVMLKRYKEIAIILTGAPDAKIEDGINWVRDLVLSMNIPPLTTYGIDNQDFPTIIEKSAIASSMKANPIELTYQEMETILTMAL